MKAKYLVLGMVLVLLAGGLWAGRAAWRIHRQLVTLNVHNVPLADVLRKIERQTWKQIRAEKSLEARITLHVTDKPLAYVLDRLAEQAGAHWSTLYAVYDSAKALKNLDSVLGDDGKLEPAGWTKIAPNPSALPPPGPDDLALLQAAGPKPEAAGPGGAPQRRMMFRRAGNGATFVQNGNGQMEVWSAEELLMETSLKVRLTGEPSETVTAAAAAETARKVKGRCATYLAFRKSSMGIGVGPPPMAGPGSAPGRHNPNDRFATLTPEQRVLRARERMRLNPK